MKSTRVSWAVWKILHRKKNSFSATVSLMSSRRGYKILMTPFNFSKAGRSSSSVEWCHFVSMCKLFNVSLLICSEQTAHGKVGKVTFHNKISVNQTLIVEIFNVERLFGRLFSRLLSRSCRAFRRCTVMCFCFFVHPVHVRIVFSAVTDFLCGSGSSAWRDRGDLIWLLHRKPLMQLNPVV